MPVEIKKEEEIVISWLKKHGYFRVEPEQNHVGIEADGKMRRMIVAVRTPQSNHNGFASIKKLAQKMNREAWLAMVEPDDDDDITWSILG